MRIAMINASPKLMIRKQDTSASYVLLQDLRRQLRREHIHDFEDFHVKTGNLDQETFDALLKCDVWVFSFPIYAGGLPSHLLSFLTELDRKMAGLSPEEKVRAAGERAEDPDGGSAADSVGPSVGGTAPGAADDSRSGDILVYAIGNGGLFEGNEAYPAFRMIALWCGACPELVRRPWRRRRAGSHQTARQPDRPRPEEKLQPAPQ